MLYCLTFFLVCLTNILLYLSQLEILVYVDIYLFNMYLSIIIIIIIIDNIYPTIITFY